MKKIFITCKVYKNMKNDIEIDLVELINSEADTEIILKFPSGNTYPITYNHDCVYLTIMINNKGKKEEEIYFSQFEDVFRDIILPFRIDIKTVKIMGEEHVRQGLAYFGCMVLINKLQEELYKYRKKELKKEVEQFFEKYIEYLPNQYWEDLSLNPCLSEEFFEKHKDKVDWNSIFGNPNLSEEFFEKYIDKVNWYRLCSIISEQFFEKYKDRIFSEDVERDSILWKRLCMNTNLSEEFFEKYIDKLEWWYILENPSISEEFFERHWDRVKEFKSAYIRNPGSESFIEKIGKKELLPSPRLQHWFLLEISKNKNLSPQFIERQVVNIMEHNKNILYTSLISEINVTEEFIEKYMDVIDFDQLCHNPHVSEQFFEKYIDKVNWYHLSQNPNISEQFFDKYKIYTEEYVKLNNNLSPAFFQRCIDYYLQSRPLLQSVYEFYKRNRNKVIFTGLTSTCILGQVLLQYVGYPLSTIPGLVYGFSICATDCLRKDTYIGNNFMTRFISSLAHNNFENYINNTLREEFNYKIS